MIIEEIDNLKVGDVVRCFNAGCTAYYTIRKISHTQSGYLYHSVMDKTRSDKFAVNTWVLRWTFNRQLHKFLDLSKLELVTEEEEII
jgi:hypothetical protein